MVGATALMSGGCKSDDVPDARVHLIDANLTPDTAPVPVPTHNASISVNDLVGYVTGVGKVTAARGGSVSISMQPLAGNAVPAAMGGSTATPPCYAIRYGAASFPHDEDQGTIAVTLAAGTGTAPTQTVPTCAFLGASLGYRCLSNRGNSGAFAATGLFTDTSAVDAGTTTFTAGDAGRWILVTSGGGAGTAAGIISAPSSTTAQTPFTTVLVTGPYLVLGGLGPIAGGPSFLNDGNTVQVTLTPKAGSVFGAAAVSTTAMNTPVTWNFDAPTDAKMTAGNFGINGAGTATAQTFACDGSFDAGANSCGGPNAAGTIVAIDVTDTAPSANNSFPPPTTKSGTLVCSTLGQTSVTVPANVMQILKDGQPWTAARVTVLRVAFQPKTVVNGLAANTINIVAGRGYATVSTAP